MIKNITVKGSIFSFILYWFIFVVFPIIFKDTPVNILALSSVDGGKNLAVNVLFYVIFSFSICLIVLLFMKDKVRWFKGLILGLFAAVILTYLIIVIFIYNWRAQTTSYLP